MRFAFDIQNPSKAETIIGIRAAHELADNPYTDEVILQWSDGVFDGITAESLSVWGLVRSLCKQVENAKADVTSPIQVVRAILAHGGTQVVWDAKAKKWRNLTLAKDGSDTYAVGDTGLTVDIASDADKDAIGKRARRAVADAMAEQPEKAEALAKWFAAGMPVEKVADGKLPKHHTIQELAHTKADAELVTQPIKRITLRGNDEE